MLSIARRDKFKVLVQNLVAESENIVRVIAPKLLSLLVLWTVCLSESIFQLMQNKLPFNFYFYITVTSDISFAWYIVSRKLVVVTIYIYTYSSSAGGRGYYCAITNTAGESNFFTLGSIKVFYNCLCYHMYAIGFPF